MNSAFLFEVRCREQEHYSSLLQEQNYSPVSKSLSRAEDPAASPMSPLAFLSSVAPPAFSHSRILQPSAAFHSLPFSVFFFSNYPYLCCMLISNLQSLLSFSLFKIFLSFNHYMIFKAIIPHS